ncbi:MAG: tRNA adenosine(34) deaminase TadA [Clostridiales bacterium]|nr:tRNA adenosine(34) deaminase TadA [Clostridiales bacterium]
MTDIDFMKKAIELAELSAQEDEVPVGAIIVKGSEIISTGRNRRETEKNALAHAELEAINKACLKLGGWRLWECEMYVTLEPCPMCTGAIINSRLKRVVFGAYDKKAGSCGSVINLFDLPYNHKPELLGGVLEEECSQQLSEFFKNLRKRKK